MADLTLTPEDITGALRRNLAEGEFDESFWQAFLIAIGSGGILDDGWGPRLVTFTFVFAGVFLTGSLIGVLVAAVEAGSPAAQRGLRAGDVIVAVNRQRVASVSELRDAGEGANSLLLNIRRGSTQLLLPIR